MPSHGSLFAGIGGLDLGLERAGFQTIWQVEIDDWCRQVLAKHWPDVPRFRDIRTVGRHNLETPDLISGGFPCQPVSVAGKRKGQADPRWLWPEFARVVDELRPQFVLVENVPGLYHRGMGDILVDLASLGYDAEWDSIPAAALGAPHLRYRVYLVAHAESDRRSSEREWSTTRYFDGEGELRRESTTHWDIEPDVGRVADGVPARLDRLRGLGNAVVPQIAEWVGRQLLDAV